MSKDLIFAHACLAHLSQLCWLKFVGFFFFPNCFSNFSWYLADLPGAKSVGQGGGCCCHPCHLPPQRSGWGSCWSGFWEHLADIYSLRFSAGSDTTRRKPSLTGKRRLLQADPWASADLSDEDRPWGGGVQRAPPVCKTRRERTFQFRGRSLG